MQASVDELLGSLEAEVECTLRARLALKAVGERAIRAVLVALHSRWDPRLTAIARDASADFARERDAIAPLLADLARHNGASERLHEAVALMTPAQAARFDLATHRYEATARVRADFQQLDRRARGLSMLLEQMAS